MFPTSRAWATGTAGDWFTGTNRVDDREWQTRSQVLRIMPRMGETDEQLATLSERTAQNVRASLDTLRRVLTDGACS